jgi:hypothetical protein
LSAAKLDPSTRTIHPEVAAASKAAANNAAPAPASTVEYSASSLLAPRFSRISIKEGMSAASSGPDSTSMKNEGARNAMRYASMASPAPNNRAARITFIAPATLATAVHPPTVMVSASIPQLVRGRASEVFMGGPGVAYFLR